MQEIKGLMCSTYLPLSPEKNKTNIFHYPDTSPFSEIKPLIISEVGQSETPVTLETSNNLILSEE